MAAPSLAERTWSGDVDEGVTGETDQCTFTYPATVNSGDRLIAAAAIDDFGGGGTTATAPSGWTILVQGTASGGDHLVVMERIADGTETGTVAMTHDGGAELWIGPMLRITGAHASTASTAVIDTTQTSTSTPDCPASGTVAEGDYLAVVVAVAEFGSAAFSANPTNYETFSTTDPITSSDTSDNTGGTGSGTSIATAVRQLTGITSENPGTFTHNQSTSDNATATILVPAAAAGGSALPLVNAMMLS